MKQSFGKNQAIAFFMAAVSVLALIATDIYAPAMPAVKDLLHTSTTAVQLTVTIFLIAVAVSQLIYGPLSDYFGRRPILIFGLYIYLFGSLLCWIAPSITTLWLGRLIQGLGAGAILALNRVIIKDLFSGPQLSKVLSYIATFIALAPAIAPALGGFIQMHWGWRWTFGFLFIYAAGITIWSFFSLDETNQNVKKNVLSLSHILDNYWIVAKNKIFWANAICTGLAFSTMITYSVINPYLFENVLGQTPGQYGLWAMIATSGFLLGMITNSRVVERFGIENTLITGNVILLLMSLFLVICGHFHWTNVTTLLLPTMGLSFGIALIFPNAFVGAMAPFTTMTGVASALYGCLQITISFALSLVIAVLDESSQLPMGLLLLTLALISLAIYHVLSRRPLSLNIKTK